MPQNVFKTGSKNIMSIFDSSVRKEVYTRAVNANPYVSTDDLIVLMGISWSDDFDPYSSIMPNRSVI